MPEVDFGNSEGAAPAPVIEAQAQVVEPATPETPASPAVEVPAVVDKPGALAPAGLVLGDKLPEFKDIIMPRINIVQGTGQLKDSFPQGAIIHGQSLEIYRAPVIDAKTNEIKTAGTPPVNIIVLGFRPNRFVEKVKGGERGMIVNTEADVAKAGGTLDYNEWNLKKDSGMKRFEALADAVVLIERPAHCADDDTVFIYEVEGKKYALALWSMKGTAYTHAAKRVFFTNRQMGCLRKGYPTMVFRLSTRTEKQNGNTYYVPVCINGERTSDALLEFIKGILSAK